MTYIPLCEIVIIASDTEFEFVNSKSRQIRMRFLPSANAA